MQGIILCGGQSTRMGTDKGMLKQEAGTWARSAMDKLTGLGLPVKISVNSLQYSGYAEEFGSDLLIADNETLNIKGPLLGVLSCHLQCKEEDLFILACDIPLMEFRVLEELYRQYQEDSNAEAFLFSDNGEPEPLCAIYTAKGLNRIYNMLKNGELLKFSMKFMLDHLDAKMLAIPEDQKKYFQNFNAHAQLNGM